MPNLAPQPRQKVVRVLIRAYGCVHGREGARHTVFVKAGVPEPIVLPRHNEISPGVIRNICKILGASVEEFLQKLRNG
jgi:hypothetical protein